MLTAVIQAISARFDHECHRTLARTVDATQEFDADSTAVLLRCYPLETVQRFDLKSTEAEGWVEQTGIDYLLRQGGVLRLARPLGQFDRVARVTYTGGYALPGATAAAGQTPLPPDLAHAAIEQAACWYQRRDQLGLARLWEYHGAYRQFAELDLLREVQAVLDAHTRWTL
jgi:hypothetical protein